MKIAEAAETSGLSAHTIRFYERSGMLPDIDRGPDGHRRFMPKTVELLTLLYWLRETGMPLADMRRFAALIKTGDSAKNQRRQILLDHAELLNVKRASLDKCESILAAKIASYSSVDLSDDVR